MTALSLARPLRVLDLFSGIGAFALGLERAGLRISTFCEAASFPRQTLARHWPDTPILQDVRDIRARIECDVICGGFPCQAFSTAARGRNRAEKDLWSEMERVIALCRPTCIIGENVSEQSVRYAADRVSSMGYAVIVRRISGAEIGAWHQRNRWWFVAHPHDEGKFHRAFDAEMARLPSLCAGLWSAETYARAVRVPAGSASGMDEARLIALGNAGFPVITEAIGRAIMSAYAEIEA